MANARQLTQAHQRQHQKLLAFSHWLWKRSKNDLFYLFYELNIYFVHSPTLTWRDIQHLTVLTSKRNSLYDAKNRFHWTMNGVGLEFNHLFGFGVLDAGGMVTLSKQWQTVPPRYHCEAGAVTRLQ